ncbi:MAG: 50S ribosomal protein L31 [Candidatus Roizmanbacteria bacterium]|nr:MAG: 50S ribosomal protein L31 [Candidatus Roizmanbacteria bacterium]
MKAKIHPTYFPEAKVVCSCGNTFTTGSTKEHIKADVCHKCHPYYTGEHRFLDTKGRVEKFQIKQKQAKEYKEKTASKKAKTEEQKERETKSLRELLEESK